MEYTVVTFIIPRYSCIFVGLMLISVIILLFGNFSVVYSRSVDLVSLDLYIYHHLCSPHLIPVSTPAVKNTFFTVYFIPLRVTKHWIRMARVFVE